MAGASMAADWTQDFFEGPWAAFHHGLFPAAQSDAEAVAARRWLDLPDGAAVLDAPCGEGRHSVRLAAGGLRVTGLDGSAELLAIAAREAEARGVAGSCTFLRRDLRSLGDLGPFDGAINLWSSFGYFSDAENEAFAADLARCLRPGARLVMDTQCLETLARNWAPRGWMGSGDVRVMEERSFDAARGRVTSRWTWAGPALWRESVMEIRVYAIAELCALLRRAGFSEVHPYGSPAGEAFQIGVSPRLWLVARR